MTIGPGDSQQLWEAFGDRQPTWAARQETPAAARPLANDRCQWLTEPIEDCLTRRRSVRHFEAAAVPRSQILGAIEAARAAEEAVWPRDRHGGLRLDFLLAAFDVTGLGQGIYATGRTGTELLSEDLGYLDVLREQYLAAPALLLLCADLNQACRDAGPAGYPAALTRAGTAGYAAWLWSISAGLAGCLLGGASRYASAAARLKNQNLRHLFTVAIGLP